MKGSLTARAYDQIYRDIIRCALAPGRAVSEAALAERYGIGKAPIRSALARLAETGLITPVHRRGYVVAPITVRRMLDLFEGRALIEGHLARAAAGRLDPARLEALSAACDTTGGEEAFLEANRRLHRYIAQGSGNEMLAEILDRMIGETARLLHLGITRRARIGAALPEGRPALVEALLRGDGEAAARIAVAHVEAVRAMVVEAVLANPDLGRIELPLAAGPPQEPEQEQEHATG